MKNASDRSTIALTSHTANAVIAYRTKIGSDVIVPVLQQQFLADVAQLARLFPPNIHLLNLCKNRYHFMVGVAAALVSGKTSLLPSTYSAKVIEQVREFAPDAFSLSDESHHYDTPADMLRVSYPAEVAPPAQSTKVPTIADDHVAAYVFTSGSTGTPVPHAKTWGKLVANARAAQKRLGILPGSTLVGTVPPQHMYGLESTVLMTLHGGCAIWEGHPFHPAEIAACLAQIGEPRVLVTTPVHLRALLGAAIDYPVLQGMLCATAPLPADLALAAEQRLKGPLTEIYGCTETGQLATRRTTQTADWKLHDGITLQAVEGGYQASGGHIEEKITLNDIVVPVDAQHFRLEGRSADVVNIAGKRSSLSYLVHQLLAIDGVQDGCYFMPQPDRDQALPDTMRLCAVAVAPGRQAKDILRAMRQRIDAVFLPRPLILLDQMPRNETGKIPQDVLQKLWRERMRRKFDNTENDVVSEPG